MAFKPYMHVERISSDDCEGLLDNDHIFVTSKIDGSNGVVWIENDTICAGSRKRELSAEDDNAGFWTWAHSDKPEPTMIRDYLNAHPTHRIFGEWMGPSSRFLGSIKSYDSEAHGKLIIFDVFDDETLSYLPDDVWRPELEKFGLNDNFTTAVLAVVDHPTLEDIEAIANNNTYLLTNAERKGEGVVLKCHEWRNKYGRQQFGKLVLEEYTQQKRKPKFIPQGDLEHDIVAYYITEAELSKTIAKVCTANNTDQFDKKSPKMVGMFLSMMWKDLLTECPNFVKKFKQPIVNFAILKAECDKTCRAYLGF